MRNAQLSMFDTTYVEWADRGKSTDFVLWWAFRADREIDIPSLVEHLTRKIAVSDVLNRRLRHVPRHLDYPYWVVGVEDIASAITVDPRERISWPECMQRMIDMTAEPLDVTVVPWAFRIFRSVDGVLGGAEPCLVVSMTVSHAVFAGQATGPLSEYLWGPDGGELIVPGLPSATHRYSAAAAVIRSIRAIGQTAASLRHLLRSKPTTAAPRLKVDWAGREHWSASDERTIAMSVVDVPRGSAYTVTQLWVAAVPRALARFHDDPRFAAATVNMPISVPYEALMGANNLMFLMVDVDLENSAKAQLESVRGQMRTQIQSHNGESGLAAASVAKRVPRYAQRMALNASGATLDTGDNVLSSMRFAPQTSWEVAGAPLAGAGLVPSGNIGRLVQTVWTTGDTMTVAVAARPQQSADVEKYLTMLVEEFQALVMATPKRAD